MARGIMYVETRPKSADVADEYHEWYEAHMREVIETDGFVSARRLRPLDGDGSFVAIYEIEADDLADVARRLREASASRATPPSPALQTDPAPVVRFFEQFSAVEA